MTRFRKIRGGGQVNCTAEGFDETMREASLGRNYPNAIGSLHEEGEKMEFTMLANMAFRGILQWYCNKCKTDIARVRALPELAILGAFFLRYKVVLENRDLIMTFMKRGRSDGFSKIFEKQVMDTTKLEKMATNLCKMNVPACTYIKQKLALSSEEFANFLGIDFSIQVAIERVQCLMYYICKHSALPDGFVMDPRIEKRARSPILIKTFSDDLTQGIGDPVRKLRSLYNGCLFLEEANRDFASPEVTFNVL